MTKVKTYQSKLYARYSTRVEVDGVGSVTVEFDGGFKQGTLLNGGRFTTVDKKLQEAIENSNNFKKGDILLAYEQEMKVAPKKDYPEFIAPKKESKPLPEKKVKDTQEPTQTEDTDVIDKEFTDVPSVTTRQQARMYFRDTHKATGMSPTLSDKLLSELCQKYQVKFTNLK